MNEQLPDPIQQITGQVRSIFYLVDEPTTILTIQLDVQLITVRASGQMAPTWLYTIYSSYLIGTTMNNMPVEALKYWKPAHYDHGSAVAAADVDGDGLLDLYFVNQLGPNQLWRNLGHGKFEDITTKAGVGLVDQIAVTASFADVDNDGDPDLFVTTVRHGNHLFENVGNGRFRDITKEAGLAYTGHSSGAVFFDFDNDGLLDLFLVNVGVYTSDKQGRGGYYIALSDAFYGHLYPERTELSILYKNLDYACQVIGMRISGMYEQ